MRSFFWRVIAVSFIVPLIPAHVVAEEEDSGSVKVVVSDTFGRPISGARVTLTSVGPSEKFAAAGGEAQFDRVPFGLYELEVRLAGFVARRERVRMYQSSLVLYAGLELAANHAYERPEVSGSVLPDVKGRSNLWVRLVALYSSDLLENVVDSGGKFELAGMAAGKYLLFLLQKDQVLSMKSLEILGGKQAVDLTLPTR